MASRIESPAVEPLGAGRCTTRSTAITARKLTVLIANAVATPATATVTAASAGATTRARFHCAVDNPMAATSWSAGTRSGSIDWNAGKPMALAQPVRNEMRAMIAGAPWWVATTVVMIAASTSETPVDPISSRRRLTRSASTPPTGPSSATGRNPRAATVPFHAA